MLKVFVYSMLLLAGLAGSQVMPPRFEPVVGVSTMIALAFIMIHVGYEFDLDTARPKKYAWDFVVAAVASILPWIACAAYFGLVMRSASTQALLQGLFAAPTSAGVLFSMLAAAGLGGSWMFHKARVLAIFDDLSTLLLLVPLKMLLIGLRPELFAVVAIMFVLLVVAWRYLHRVLLPITWPFVLLYAVLLAGGCVAIFRLTSVQLEVLLPAFTLGCVLRRPPGEDPHRDESRIGHEEGPEWPNEQRVATVVSAAFMVGVGLSMPKLFSHPAAGGRGCGIIALHVLAITALSNAGKLFPALCYRAEATVRERLALAVGMFPRGEVGAGVLVIGLAYGMAGDTLTVAVLSLAVNLLATGGFILIVKRLLKADRSGVAMIENLS